MKFIFFGTPEFSARTLQHLLDHGFIPEAVVCNPDRPVGRKKIVTAPPVKTVAKTWSEKNGRVIEILQPEKLDEAFTKKLKSFDLDIFIVFAYGKIFRKNILDIPRHGTIGVHPSFLPHYRGPSPFQTALLNGDQQTGVTLHLLDEGIDSGPIIARSEPVTITENDNFNSLAEKLADAAAQLLIATIPNFLEGEIKLQPQNESQATFTKKFKTEDGFITQEDIVNPEKAREIFWKIRAFNPEPGAWTVNKDDKRMKLLDAKIESGKLVLIETQIEGEKPRKLY